MNRVTFMLVLLATSTVLLISQNRTEESKAAVEKLFSVLKRYQESDKTEAKREIAEVFNYRALAKTMSGEFWETKLKEHQDEFTAKVKEAIEVNAFERSSGYFKKVKKTHYSGMVSDGGKDFVVYWYDFIETNGDALRLTSVLQVEKIEDKRVITDLYFSLGDLDGKSAQEFVESIRKGRKAGDWMAPLNSSQIIRALKGSEGSWESLKSMMNRFIEYSKEIYGVKE